MKKLKSRKDLYLYHISGDRGERMGKEGKTLTKRKGRRGRGKRGSLKSSTRQMLTQIS
jgi:hypothetical protein